MGAAVVIGVVGCIFCCWFGFWLVWIFALGEEILVR